MAAQPRPRASLAGIYFDWADEIHPDRGARYSGHVYLFADKVVFSGRTVRNMGGCLLFGVLGVLLGALIGKAASKKKKIVFSTSKGQARIGRNPYFSFEVEPGKWLVCGWGLSQGREYKHFVRILEELYQERMSKS